MPGKKTQGAPKPTKGKGRTFLGELDPNVQPPTGAASAGPSRSRRSAAVKAGSAIADQYNNLPELESPSSSQPSKGKVGSLAKSARDSSPVPGPSRPSKRQKASKSVPVPLESESDPDFPSDEDALSERLSDDGLDDEAFEGFGREYLPCAENGDEEFEDDDDDEIDLEDQSDVESDFVDPSEDGDEEDAPISAKAKGKRPARTAAPVPKVAGSRRPKKARKTASRKSPSSKVSAKEWLRDQNKKSGIKPDDPNVKRFQQLMSHLVGRLSAKCRGVETQKEKSKLNEALGWDTQDMLREMEPTDICEAIFENMPLVTQQILGKPNLEARDLQGLPKGATQLNLPGTYLDVLGRFKPNQIKREPHPDYKFVKIKDVRTLKPFVSEASALEIRLYLGSSTAILLGRIRIHILEMNRPDDDKKTPEAAHYREFGNRHDVVPDFRVTSVWNPEDDERFPKMTEGLLMTYLGLQNSGKDSRNHPAETFELNLEVRAGLGLPDFMRISLNRAWPLYQGVGAPSKEKHTCENPTHPANWDHFPVNYSSRAEGYRCQICISHFILHGRDWPIRKDGQPVRKSSSAVERERGCANPRHKEECDAHCEPKRSHIVGGVRCASCRAWIHEHGRDYPFNKNGVDTSTEDKICQNPGHESSWGHNAGGVAFRKNANGLRCHKCAMWHNKEGKDYPHLSNGEVMRRLCQNPGHPAEKEKNHNVRLMGSNPRCGHCSNWYYKYGHDYPDKA